MSLHLKSNHTQAAFQQPRVHFMRNALAYAGKSQRRIARPGSAPPPPRTMLPQPASNGPTSPTRPGHDCPSWPLLHHATGHDPALRALGQATISEPDVTPPHPHAGRARDPAGRLAPRPGADRALQAMELRHPVGGRAHPSTSGDLPGIESRVRHHPLLRRNRSASSFPGRASPSANNSVNTASSWSNAEA